MPRVDVEVVRIRGTWPLHAGRADSREAPQYGCPGQNHSRLVPSTPRQAGWGTHSNWIDRPRGGSTLLYCGHVDGGDDVRPGELGGATPWGALGMVDRQRLDDCGRAAECEKAVG